MSATCMETTHGKDTKRAWPCVAAVGPRREGRGSPRSSPSFFQDKNVRDEENNPAAPHWLEPQAAWPPGVAPWRVGGRPPRGQQEGRLSSPHGSRQATTATAGVYGSRPTPTRLPASPDFRLGVRVVHEELTAPQMEHAILWPHGLVQGHPRDLSQCGHLGAGADEDAAASGAAGKQLEDMRETRPGTSQIIRSSTRRVRAGSFAAWWKHRSTPHWLRPPPPGGSAAEANRVAPSTGEP